MSETEIQSRELTSSEAQCIDAPSCPFLNGPETLDILLAELAPAETDLLDAALDLRSSMQTRTDAAASLRELCRLRALLDGRHYLAFYRVRCWVHREIRAEVRTWRGEPWRPVALPRDCGRFDAAVNICLAAFAGQENGWHDTASVRFRFADSPQSTLLIA